MASQPDLIERLWTEVINVDPSGKWMKPAGDETENYRKTIAKVRAKAAAEDLGGFVRFIRYETCFSVISTLEERGLPKIGLDAVIKELRALPKNQKAPRSVANYFLWLDLNLRPGKDDSDWIADLGKDKQEDSPFGDTGPTIKRLLSSGATKEDLGEIAAWQRYVAVLKAHEFIQQSGHDEFEGLHEDFLSSDPSGLEGRPGSWPVKSPAKSASKIEPLWKTRSGQALAFSPDSRRVAIAGASGPARIFDTKTGKELAVCDSSVKAHIHKMDFSPDGKQLAVAEMYDRCDVCDAANGQLIKKRAFPKRKSDAWQISGLAYGPSGDLIRPAWQNLIDVINVETFEPLEPLRPAASTRSVDAIAMTPDRRKLAAIWQPSKLNQHNVTVWSWPEREVLLQFQYRCDVLSDIAFSPDGQFLAVTYDQLVKPESKRGVYLFDAVSGTLLQAWPGPHGSLRFARNDFLFCSDDDHLWAADLKSPDRTGKLRVCTPNQSIYEMAISPCFKYLATAGSAGAAVWDVKALLAAMGL